MSSREHFTREGDRVKLSSAAIAFVRVTVSQLGVTQAMRALHVGPATLDRLLLGYARQDTVSKIEDMVPTASDP